LRSPAVASAARLFNLGLLQALAEAGRLQSFDYLSTVADPNQLTMHSFYKARLIRAYMGASNVQRGKAKDADITDAVPVRIEPQKSFDMRNESEARVSTHQRVRMWLDLPRYGGGCVGGSRESVHGHDASIGRFFGTHDTLQHPPGLLGADTKPELLAQRLGASLAGLHIPAVRVTHHGSPAVLQPNAGAA